MEDLQGFIGLWIIDKNSGLPINSVELGKKYVDSVLFGGFLVALRGMSHDFEIGQLTSFQTDAANLLIAGSEEILSVIAIDRESNPDRWYPVLVTINDHSQTFYGSTLRKEGLMDTDSLDDLVPEFKRIIMKNIISMKTDSKGKEKKAEKVTDKLKDSGLW